MGRFGYFWLVLASSLLCISQGRHLQNHQKGLSSKAIVAAEKQEGSIALKTADALVASNSATLVADGNALKGVSCIIGGALAHLAFGSFYCWCDLSLILHCLIKQTFHVGETLSPTLPST